VVPENSKPVIKPVETVPLPKRRERATMTEGAVHADNVGAGLSAPRRAASSQLKSRRTSGAANLADE
jgi:hypothetical protein